MQIIIHTHEANSLLGKHELTLNSLVVYRTLLTWVVVFLSVPLQPSRQSLAPSGGILWGHDHRHHCS